ncbi:MAG: uncharacterized protein QOK44_4713 [Betaproteobacteria bacterium]|jgi:uncharacterized protein YigA (DUF484 family)|nr:uncharacterized protein [Betaproteobacteria bacterium]
MTPDAVASYLGEHPEFFEQYADMLADIYIPHPHGGRAIPISERQILTLRERSKQLEAKLREVIQFGEENDAIGEKVHRLALALIGARDLASVISTIHYNLREDFAVPHIALRAWNAPGASDVAELNPASEATREFTTKLVSPFCSTHAPEGTSADLFAASASLLKSFSYIPLRDSDTFGLLALASEDAERFYPEMGTVYLKRIGDMVGAAVRRNLRPE